MERIKTSSEHLLSLVNEILDLAKVESGQMQIVREQVPVRETVDSVLALILPQAGRSGVEVQNEIEHGTGAAYSGDPDRVRQILVNLLTNAVKFTRPGGRVRLTCTTTDQPHPAARARGKGPWLRIDVEDTGIGIAPEHQDEIFEPFYQVDGGYTRESGGTGLGLSISRRLARLMGGDITVWSHPGEGSCFTLWLPSASGGTAELQSR